MIRNPQNPILTIKALRLGDIPSLGSASLRASASFSLPLELRLPGVLKGFFSHFRVQGFYDTGLELRISLSVAWTCPNLNVPALIERSPGASQGCVTQS